MHLEMGALSVIVNKPGKTNLSLCGVVSVACVTFLL